MNTNGEEIQMEMYEAGDKAAQLLPVSFEEWETRAREILAAGPFGYVFGGAGAGDTMAANREAFQKWRIQPRICCDISERNLRVEVFEQQFPIPFMLAPIGVLSILHPDAELAPAKASADFGIPYILSNVSTRSMEEIAKIMGTSARWFQLYPPRDHMLTQSFLQRAEATGYTAIIVTVDSTLLGWRERDLRNGYFPFLHGHGMGNYFSDPVFRSKLKEPPEENMESAVKLALVEGNNTCFTWKELEFIRNQTSLPLLLKGVTHPEDAKIALDLGVDGLIVSNHGGRQLDGAVATLEALPSIQEVIANRVPVFLDSGIRRGADIVKALSLGATAVLIGRPYAYALAVAGRLGVQHVIQNLIAQTELQLAISGRSSIRDLDRSVVKKA